MKIKTLYVIMTKDKTKSIKNVSKIVLILSGVAFFTNGAGLAMSYLIDLDFMFYSLICVSMIIIAVLYFFGSYHMLQFKSWSRVFVILISIIILSLSFLGILYSLLFLSYESENIPIKVASVAGLVFWGVPLFFLLRFLFNSNVKAHFTR